MVSSGVNAIDAGVGRPPGRGAAMRAALACVLLFGLALGLPADARADRARAPGFYPGGAAEFICDRGAYRDFLERNKDRLNKVAAFSAAIQAHPATKKCVDAEPLFCVASLAQTLPVGSRFAAGPDAAEWNAPLEGLEVDINGKPMASPLISLRVLDGQALTFLQQYIYLLTVDDGSVWSIDISLPNSPLEAKTFEAYQATKVYEAAVVAAPGDCDLSDRRAFCQFIENRMKPTEKRSRGLLGDEWVDEVTGELAGLRVSIRYELTPERGRNGHIRGASFETILKFQSRRPPPSIPGAR
jgi:hypothetical protein